MRLLRDVKERRRRWTTRIESWGGGEAACQVPLGGLILLLHSSTVFALYWTPHCSELTQYTAGLHCAGLVFLVVNL